MGRLWFFSTPYPIWENIFNAFSHDVLILKSLTDPKDGKYEHSITFFWFSVTLLTQHSKLICFLNCLMINISLPMSSLQFSRRFSKILSVTQNTLSLVHELVQTFLPRHKKSQPLINLLRISDNISIEFPLWNKC